MSRLASEYPERVHSSGHQGERRHLSERGSSGGLSIGWLIAGLAGIGLAAWMAWHFGPDLKRYVKMERM